MRRGGAYGTSPVAGSVEDPSNQNFYNNSQNWELAAGGSKGLTEGRTCSGSGMSSSNCRKDQKEDPNDKQEIKGLKQSTTYSERKEEAR